MGKTGGDCHTIHYFQEMMFCLKIPLLTYYSLVIMVLLSVDLGYAQVSSTRYVAAGGDDVINCGVDDTSPCGSISWAIQQAEIEAMEGQLVILVDSSSTSKDPLWACIPDCITLHTSVKIASYGGGKATIGCSATNFTRLLEINTDINQRPCRKEELKQDGTEKQMSTQEQEYTGTTTEGLTEATNTTMPTVIPTTLTRTVLTNRNTVRAYFHKQTPVHLHFSDIILQSVLLNIVGDSIQVEFDKVDVYDSKWISDKNIKNLSIRFKNSKWSGQYAPTCNITCDPTGFIQMEAINLNLKIEHSAFYHTEVFINVSGLADIFISHFLFSNIETSDSVHGKVYINLNNETESRVIVENSLFEKQVNSDPIVGIQNLYYAALMVRTVSHLYDNGLSNTYVNVTNCSFEQNERGLTFIGAFRYTSVENCTFTGNIAMHAGGGLLYLTHKDTPSYIRDCLFENNEAGSYWASKLHRHEDSFQILGDEVRIQSNCCKGLISFVGKGGAIRLQKGNLTIVNATFMNNTARLLGGAIYVDRVSTLDAKDVYFENTPQSRHELQGDLFYSNGRVQIRSAQMMVATAMNHVTILRHSGERWSIEVGDIVIQCPIGYRLRVTNTSAYGVSPIGLLRSYKLDELSYNCESCPRHKYSLDYGYLNFSLVYSSITYFTLLINGDQPQSAYTGTYEYQDIECQQCPYGGKCVTGITAVANFWGYIHQGQVRFQHCPKGYCCGSTSCSHYSKCAENREGRLCGSCSPGYSEALFSPECISDARCDSFWLWPLALATGLSYALFLLYQKDIRDLMFLNTVSISDIPFPLSRKNAQNEMSGPDDEIGEMQMTKLEKETHIPLNQSVNIDQDGLAEIEYLHNTVDDHDQIYHESCIDGIPFDAKQYEFTDEHLSDATSNDNTAEGKSGIEVDIGAGFLIILFFYFQDAQLLQIKTVFASEENKKRELFKEILNGLFNFRVEISQFMDNVCFITGITPTSKLLIKVILVPFVLILFGIMYIVYRCLQSCKRKRKRKAHAYTNGSSVINELSATHATESQEQKDAPKKTFASKLASGFVLALLFTYQMLATTCLTLLNCVPVGEHNVLFIEGTVICYTALQNGVMLYTVLCIVPFCLVLLIGPGLLKQGYITLPQFFCGCLVPLPFLIFWVALRLRVKGHGPKILPDHSEEAVSVMEILQGPFKDNIHPVFGPLCGAGVLLARRLVIILLFTFVNDTLIRMLCIMMVCFVILLHHVHVLPYKDTRGNMAGSASAAALLVVGGINLVRAAFEAAEYTPMGPNEMLMKVFDELELVLLLWLPAAVMGVAILLMTFKIILHILKYCFKKV